MSKKLTIRDKSKFITDKILSQDGLTREDTLSYQYLYDITKFLVNRKLNTRRLSSDIPGEIVQNIVVQIFSYFNTDNSQNRTIKLKSIFPYISQCVNSEFCKLNRNKYLGQSYIISEHQILSEEDSPLLYTINFDSEFHYMIRIEKMASTIIKETKYLLEENIIPVENKHLLFFPLILSIARRDEKLINKFCSRVKIVLKQIYNDVGDPKDRIK